MIGRLQYAARQLVLAAHPGVICVWDPSEYPRGVANGPNLIALSAARGPTMRQSERLERALPTSALLTVADPAASSRIGIKLSSVRRFADLDGAPTNETARDALLAVLNEAVIGPALLPGVTAVAVGTDQIRLTGAIGTMYDLSVFGTGLSLAVETEQDCKLVTGQAFAVLDVEAFASGRAPIAQELLSGVETALRGADVDEISDATGVDFERHAVGEIVNLTSLAGATWESRAVVRIAVHLRAMRATPIETIETVEINRLRITDSAGDEIGPAAFEVTTP